MDAIKFTKDFIRDWVSMGSGKAGFTFKQNKRKRMPERTVEVTPATSDEPKKRKYTVCGFINGKQMWCESGLSIDAVVTTVWAAAHGD